MSNLFAIEFFQGAGIAFFFTAAFTFFIENLNVRELAIVFMISAILLWLANLLYTWLEHKFPVSRLSMVTTIAMAGSILLFGFGSVFIQQKWFWYALLSWYYVLYLYSNLDFWGIASLLFDVRQSRRLFGVISAGEIPAKFIGYSLASIVVVYIGTANLIFTGFIFMLCSVPFLYKVSKEGAREISTFELPAKGRQHHDKKIALIFKSFSTSTLTETIAILSFLFALIMFILNFVFYTEIKSTIHEDVYIARFIATFLAVSRVLSLLIKLVFNSRMVSAFGYKRTLLISPLILGFVIIFLLFTNHFIQNERYIFYIFGAIVIFADVLRSSLHTPIFLTLMQPLPRPERLKAHNIVKGLMDPLAYFITGLLLFVMIRIWSHANILVLCFIILFIIIFIVIGIFKVNKQYLKTLIHSITTRFFSEEQICITDDESLHVTRKKLRTGSEFEKLYILKLLEKQPPNRDVNEMILGSLDSRSPLLITEAIKICCRLNLEESIPVLKEIITENHNPEVTAEAIKALCKMDFSEEYILPLSQQADKKIRNAAILGILWNSGNTGKKEVDLLLEKLLLSDIAEDRLSLALLLSELRGGLYSHFLLKLMKDPDNNVRKCAIVSSGKNNNPELLDNLMLHFQKHENEVMLALEYAGENAVPAIRQSLLNTGIKEQQILKIFRLCIRIGGEKTCNMLVELLDEIPFARHQIIRTLYKCDFNVSTDHKSKIEKLVLHYLSLARQIIQMRQHLLLKGEDYELLGNSLRLELNEIKGLLLNLFSFLFGRRLIEQVINGLNKKGKANVANAIELIEMSIPGIYSRPFIQIFESEDLNLQARNHPGNTDSVVDLEYVFNYILLDDKLDFSKWTKASCLYDGLKNSLFFHKNILKKYIGCNELILREIAVAATQI